MRVMSANFGLINSGLLSRTIRALQIYTCIRITFGWGHEPGVGENLIKRFFHFIVNYENFFTWKFHTRRSIFPLFSPLFVTFRFTSESSLLFFGFMMRWVTTCNTHPRSVSKLSIVWSLCPFLLFISLDKWAAPVLWKKLHIVELYMIAREAEQDLVRAIKNSMPQPNSHATAQLAGNDRGRWVDNNSCAESILH